ncbi:MAG: DUF2237 domain-containing protein [Myxococcota bacterium]
MLTLVLGFALSAQLPPAQSIEGRPLETCSTSPMTGWFRDGTCRTGPRDTGTHVVCARVTDEFLRFSRSRGNDLITPRGRFPGLKAGDQWCLCALRWKEAAKVGKAPPVLPKATDEKALEFIGAEALRAKRAKTQGTDS